MNKNHRVEGMFHKWTAGLAVLLVFHPATTAWAEGARVPATDRDDAVRAHATVQASHERPVLPARYEIPDSLTPPIIVRARERVDPDSFFERHAARLGLGRHDELVEWDRDTSFVTGLERIRYRQEHRGVEVSGAGYTLTLDGGRVIWGQGRIITGIGEAAEPVESAENALTLARATVAWRLGLNFDDLVWADADTVRLQWVSHDGSGRPDRHTLAWECVVRPVGTAASYLVWVDAGDGAILKFRSQAVEAWVPATANGQATFDQLVGPFAAEQDVPAPTHRLRSENIVTLSLVGAQAGTFDFLDDQLDLAVDFLSDDSVFDEPDVANGVQVHWASLQALDMFTSGMGIPLPQGPQPLVTNYVDAPLTKGFAAHLFWLDTSIYGKPGCPIVAKDVVGHEMAHFLSHKVFTQLTNAHHEGEPGALRESFSDIIGQLLEVWIDGSSTWISADEITCPKFAVKVRNLAEPLQSPVAQPDVYQGIHWLPTAPATENNDWGGIHRNNSVQSKWFHLLAYGGGDTNSGGTTYDVIGVGAEEATRVLLENMLTLPDAGGYAEARDGSLLAAAAVCGEFSQARASAHEAWRAVGLFSAPFAAGPYIDPPEGASGVDPWPASLSFQAAGQLIEDAWLVEISENADFTGEVKSLPTTATGLLGGVEVGVAEAYLAPDTNYYWRVRRQNNPDGLECWRPLNEFTTGSMSVMPQSPVSHPRRVNEYHPWELEFTWSAHPQATSYTLEVSLDPNFSSTPVQRIEVQNPKAVLDVLVDAWHYWRVRPNFTDPDGQPVEGTWTEATFKTEMPAVLTVSPASGEQVYPWPVTFEWKKVKGADHFVFEIKLARGGWGDPAGEYQSFELPPSTPIKQLNLRGDEHLISYSWRVRVIGPKIDSLGIQEEGQEANRYFKVRGSDTRPEPVTLGPSLCPPLNQPLALEWQTVPAATRYKVTVHPSVCPQNQSCDIGEALEGFNVTAQAVSVQGIDYTPGPMAHNDAVGLQYKVRSFGPDDAPGMESNASSPPILLQPTQPELLAPLDMTEFELDDTVTLNWQSEMAHWGGFVINVYKGSNSACQGSPQLSFVQMGASSGQTTAQLWNLQFDSGTHNHSWKVRPFIIGLDWNNQHFEPCAKPQWSACNRFVVTDNIPDLVAPTVHGNLEWFHGFILAFWDKVPGADSYAVEVHQGATNGPLIFGGEWSVATLAAHKAAWDQLLVQLLGAPSDPGIWIAKIDGTVPVNAYYWKVKACKSGTCGPWSDWVIFTEINNPFPP